MLSLELIRGIRNGEVYFKVATKTINKFVTNFEIETFLFRNNKLSWKRFKKYHLLNYILR